MRMSRRMAVYGQGGAPMAFTYSGSYTISGDAKGDWVIRLLTSGTFVFTALGKAKKGIDVFLVGAGGGASGFDYNSKGRGAGGGGYTLTDVSNPVVGTSYPVVIGAGTTGNGGLSSAFGKSVSGGYAGVVDNGGNGGSGGGGYNATGGSDGSDGGNVGRPGGVGQHTTTREFGETSGTLYAGGGGQVGGDGGGGSIGANGVVNTGGGGGGAYWNSSTAATSGGSGIVVIRNHRA